jgi:hypothetical protein
LNDLSGVELDLQQESDSGGESSEESSSVSNSGMTGSLAGMPSSTLSNADAISYVACKSYLCALLFENDHAAAMLIYCCLHPACLATRLKIDEY